MHFGWYQSTKTNRGSLLHGFETIFWFSIAPPKEAELRLSRLRPSCRRQDGSCRACFWEITWVNKFGKMGDWKFMLMIPGRVSRAPREKSVILWLVFLIGWELLGFPIAYHKATMGGLLKWIGMDIHIQPDSIEVHIPVDKLPEIKTIALGFLRGNILPNKDLRSFVGKCMNIAGVLHVWKPFIKQFYAAMYAPKPVGTPQNCTWTSQIKTGLLWVLAFVDQEQELQLTKRVWHVSEFLHQGERVMISWDAPPWGFGAVLYKQMQPIEYIVSTPTEFEKELLELDVGSSSSQQVLECLAGLVALREWGPVWRNTNVKLAIRNDNIGALVLLGTIGNKVTEEFNDSQRSSSWHWNFKFSSTNCGTHPWDYKRDVWWAKQAQPTWQNTQCNSKDTPGNPQENDIHPWQNLVEIDQSAMSQDIASGTESKRPFWGWGIDCVDSMRWFNSQCLMAWLADLLCILLTDCHLSWF